VRRGEGALEEEKNPVSHFVLPFVFKSWKGKEKIRGEGKKGRGRRKGPRPKIV